VRQIENVSRFEFQVGKKRDGSMKLNVLSDKARAAIEAEFPKYPDKRSVVIFALRAAQEEGGYLSEEAMFDVAALLELTPVQVYDVATFYTMYNLQPVGKFLIQVCKTLSCAIVGAGGIVGHLKSRLGVGIGEVTPDGLFSIKLVECLASCGSGPMMQINDDYYENLTPEKVDRILEDLRREGKSPLATGRFQLPLNITADGHR
jgi:NADH-quinone oxidoreductase E subunit